MNAGDLAVFAAVAEAGGMNKAARLLHTVQSNVTQRVRLLEHELGVPLFHRHSRGVALTAAGTKLLPYAHRIGHLLIEAKQAAMDGPEPSGRLIIGSLETTAALRMPPILARFAAAHPQVDLVLQTGTTAALIDEVLARRLDGAFVAGPVRHADLTADTILLEELVIVTAPWIPSFKAWVRSAAREGREVKTIVFRSGCTYRDMLEAQLKVSGVRDIRRHELGTLDGIVGCVGAGIGITLLPLAVVQSALQEGRVAVHPPAGNQALTPTVFIRRSDCYVSTALSRFLSIAHRAGSAVRRPPSAKRSGSRRARSA
ncbi:MAG: LysR substrate-binding domain-containing protein [SAR324 cluster bacterium]